MFALTPATRVFVALAPVDLRRSFNGLCACVEQVLLQDPVSGHLFLFTNSRRTRLKILYWDGSGLWVCAKRLERGRFTWPTGDGASASLRPEELSALVNGLEVRAKKEWYRK
jgi:transposase